MGAMFAKRAQPDSKHVGVYPLRKHAHGKREHGTLRSAFSIT